MQRKWVVLGLVGALVAAGTGYAQDPPKKEGDRKGQGGRGFGAGFSAASLLSNADVQKELKLTDADKGNIKLLQEELAESGKKFWEGMQGIPREEIMSKMAERTKEEEKLLAEVLGDKMKRYNEIRLQQSVSMGGMMGAMMSPQNQQKLKFTDDQKKKLRDSMTESFREMGKFFGQDVDEKEREKAMAESRKKSDDAINALLTDEQKKTWKEMLGAPVGFEFPKFDFRMGRGRGRGGFGGPPPGGGSPPSVVN